MLTGANANSTLKSSEKISEKSTAKTERGKILTKKSAGSVSVSVKTLVEFSAKTGSLDRRFTPGPTAEQGIEGHKLIQSRRDIDYIAEMSLSLNIQGLKVSGRADGFCTTTQCMEEIKTFYGEVDNIPDNHRALHWAQALCYAYMYCLTNDKSELSVALVYFNLHEEKEYRLEKKWQINALKDYVDGLVAIYLAWHQQEKERITQRDAWINQLKFPFPSMHASQRTMAEAVYKAAVHQCQLMIQAPTGTGKTLATLFPAVKALRSSAVDKIFYLTAKGTTKQLALDAMKKMTDCHSHIRVLEITAIEKACLEPDKQCAGSSCPYAKDFYDKLPAARSRAGKQKFLSKSDLDKLACEHQICPFYLSMEMSRWVDVVIADVNYYFDINALLFGLTRQFKWKPIVLLDEAHNLIERARGMFSVKLERRFLLDAKREAPNILKSTLEQINRIWLGLGGASSKRDKLTLVTSLPEKLIQALSVFVNRYLEVLQQFPEHPIQAGIVKEFFFSVVNLQQLLPFIDDDFVIDVASVERKNDILNIRNIIPAKLLNSRLEHCAALCLFSATLAPVEYYRAMLGLMPNNTYFIDLPSPFKQEQLEIGIADISTRYRDRSSAVNKICDLIFEQLICRPGNAIVYFSSYEFLHMVEDALRHHHAYSNIELMVQSRYFSEDQRKAFINFFAQKNNILALAVLGGVFSEGIDLVGEQLKGVFVATLGIPQINPFNEYVKTRINHKFGLGYAYTYLYPGLQKVIQAAGRVIRSNQDYGYLWLLDDRYKQAEIQGLLPEHWHL